MKCVTRMRMKCVTRIRMKCVTIMRMKCVTIMRMKCVTIMRMKCVTTMTMKCVTTMTMKCVTTVISRHVSNTLHADDLAIWCSAEYTTPAAYIIQDAANKVHTWTQYWGLQINQVKTQSKVFSLSTTKEQVKIKLGDRILAQAETPIFLGVTLDSRLSWKPQIESIRKRGIQKLALLKRLSGTHLGASPRILKTGYTGTVRPTQVRGLQQPRPTQTNSTKYRTWVSDTYLVQ